MYSKEKNICNKRKIRKCTKEEITKEKYIIETKEEN